MGFLIILFLAALILSADLLFLVFVLLRAVLPILLFGGAFYAPSQKEKIEKMIELAKPRPGEKAVDLGSGDGRLVIALAQANVEAHGYEIDPLLVFLARRNIRRAGVESKAFIHWKSFWSEDLSRFDIITVYGMKHVMKRLQAKLKKELSEGGRVVSNNFTFPSWPYCKNEDDVSLYRH